ncbi:protein-disulfide reductase DsbD [Campylobacter sp. faydin G-140]|uniref:protein-disulfide reductase DsbD n=1 Tax=Campylobacter anatolicus TaxID=2829105 RepID=UPI001BA18479|nr:protein-disulfide reductase DsbD [Campylobacter anatolicus]MBR8464885.1 protein-disulfide reductase DsbD [Campylobacter anatolicus]
MVNKFVISILFFCMSMFAEVLDVSKAFMISTTTNSQNFEIKFKFAQDIYIYNDTFEIKIGGEKINQILNMPQTQISGEYNIIPQDFSLFVPFSLVEKNLQNNATKLEISYQGCAKNGICYRPQEKIYHIAKNADKFSIKELKSDKNENDDSLNEEQSIAAELMDSSFIISLVTFLGYGLLLAFTPCVFPVIPILSGIIVSKSGENMSAKHGFLLSLIYVFGMSLAYAIAGVMASVLGFGIAGALQNVWVLSAFAIIFVALAFSMFGFYDIKLPSKFENVINKNTQSSQGLLGVFVMGFASALIVSPCVAAPLAGALLYISQSGNAIYGGIMLFVMGVGMGVPLLVIGATSSKILPRPGGWMDSVKNFFGFLMLIMALWLLARVFGVMFELVGYGVIGVFMAVYFGAFDTALSGWVKFKKSVAILVFIYSVLLIVGGFLGAKDPFLPLSDLKVSQNLVQNELNFKSVHNLTELKSVIAETNKPILVDFYADWCVSCKEIESITFADSTVAKRLKEFELVRVDVTKSGADNDAMLREFGLIDPPALLFFKGKDELRNLRIIGFISVDKFLERLSKILD